MNLASPETEHKPGAGMTGTNQDRIILNTHVTRRSPSTGTLSPRTNVFRPRTSTRFIRRRKGLLTQACVRSAVDSGQQSFLVTHSDDSAKLLPVIALLTENKAALLEFGEVHFVDVNNLPCSISARAATKSRLVASGR